jgi:hypothetical protein
VSDEEKQSMRTYCFTVLVLAVVVGLCSCHAGSEPEQVTLPVVADGSGLEPFTTAEGYRVELSSLRVALSDIELTVEGEAHAGLWLRLRRLVVPVAWAHPGHYAGGEVTGELLGDFVVDAFSGRDELLGQAAMLAGAYHGMNFTFRRLSAGSSTGDDPLVGHTIQFAGHAEREGTKYPFSGVLDIEAETVMVGAPFDFNAGDDEAEELVFRLLMVDPSSENDTVFDGVNFAELTTAGSELVIEPGSATHNLLRRRIQVHDHWRLEAR